MSQTPEADLIEAAYEDQVKALYKVLFESLVDGGNAGGLRFAKGLEIARQARGIALSLVPQAKPK